MGDLACGLVSRGIPVTVLTATAANPKFNNDLPVGLEVIRLSNNLDDSKKVFNKIKKEFYFLSGHLLGEFFMDAQANRSLLRLTPPLLDC